MKSTPKPPPGNDPLYCEFIAEYVKASESDKDAYAIATVGDYVKKNFGRVLFGSIIAVAVAVLVVGATGGSPLQVGLGVALGIFIGALLTAALFRR